MELNDRIKSFWEGEAQVYSDSIQDEFKGSQKSAWLKLIEDNAASGGAHEVLDAGCGPGFFPIILGELGYHVTGIDITENMISCARENAEAYGVNASFATMDCQSLSFPDSSFDLIISRNITWTLNDPRKAYAEWYRVLKPGGRVLVFDACWYLHLFNEELHEQYLRNDERVKQKYGRPTHNHVDQKEEDALSKLLFMSDKKRPVWDMEQMLSLGFKKVFAEADITDRVWNDFTRDAYALSPQFLVGGEK